MTICSACGAENRAGRRFCAQCAASLPLTCPSCGAANEAGERFCGECGAVLVGGAPAARHPGAGAGAPAAPGPTGRPAATGPPDDRGARERKVASIVFADLVGFTALGETTDPELVQALVSRAFDRLSAEVERYEGLVEKFAGDAMLAVFGVPSAHEDDAERAVRAALEMQTAMGELAASLRAEGRPELALRIGIETGEVLVDQARAAGERDRMVTGDPVNTAARLEAAAAPGTVIVGPSTYAATRSVIDYEELPAAVVKGKALPVPAWRATSVKARRGGLRSPLGIESPLVGRDEELSLLKETVRRSTAGRPHFVTVIGAAGVGKSRLTWELEKYLDGLPTVFYWRKGRCLAYAQASYGAIADVVKGDAHILDDDRPADAAVKLRARLDELGMAAPDAEAVAEALGAMLGIAAAPSTGREALFDATRRYLGAIAAGAPLVLVLEDIHWADEGLLDLIEFLARWGDGRITLLCLARHELLDRRAAWGGGIANASTIVLRALDPADSAALLQGILPGGLPAGLGERISAVAEGNPLFTEELVRMFVDRGVLRFADGGWELAHPVADVEVPGSVQAVLAARLDGLPPVEKRLAQDAAVVGRIFWDAVLDRLMRTDTAALGELLRSLRVKELVVPREPSSLAGAAEFGFRHVLIRDVAYESLPKRDRAEKHLTVARWAETEFADREGESAELLASHYHSALRYREEFGEPNDDLRELRLRVLQHARRAGARAEGLGQLDASTRWLRLAWDQAHRLGLTDLDLARLASDLVRVAQFYETAEAVGAVSREVIDSLTRGGEPEYGEARDLVAHHRAGLAFALLTAGDRGGARDVLDQGLAALEGGPPSRPRVELLHALGWSLWRRGPVSEAFPVLERAYREAQEVGAEDLRRFVLHDLGIAHGMVGESATGVDLVEQSYRLARDAADRRLLSRCHINLPSLMMGNGSDWHEILPLLEEGIDVARRSMDRSSLAWLAANTADLTLLLGRMPEALQWTEESIAMATAVGMDSFALARRQAGALVLLLSGRPQEALPSGDAAALTIVDPELQAEVYNHLWASITGWQESPGASAASLREALRGDPLRPSWTEGALWLSRMSLRVGDRAGLDEAAGILHAANAHAGGAVGPFRILVRRWLDGLAADAATGGPEVAAVAAELEERGYLLPAADAWADAAIVFGRASAPSDAAERRAAGLYERIGAVPMLDLTVPPGAEPARPRRTSPRSAPAPSTPAPTERP